MSIIKSYQIMSRHGNLDLAVDSESGMKALLSGAFLKKGDAIIKFGAKEILSHPNYLTVQVDDNRHIHLDPEYLQFANHSCDPNFFMDTERMEFIALRDIHVGDELLFFYPSTEWKMDRPFQCQCGSPKCLGLISGASALSAEAKRDYKFNTYILSKMNESYSTTTSSAKR